MSKSVFWTIPFDICHTIPLCSIIYDMYGKNDPLPYLPGPGPCCIVGYYLGWQMTHAKRQFKRRFRRSILDIVIAENKILRLVTMGWQKSFAWIDRSIWEIDRATVVVCFEIDCRRWWSMDRSLGRTIFVPFCLMHSQIKNNNNNKIKRKKHLICMQIYIWRWVKC